MSVEGDDDPESKVTPTRDVLDEEKPFLTSRQKSVKAARSMARSFQSELRCEPFKLDDSF